MWLAMDACTYIRSSTPYYTYLQQNSNHNWILNFHAKMLARQLVFVCLLSNICCITNSDHTLLHILNTGRLHNEHSNFDPPSEVTIKYFIATPAQKSPM